MFFEWISQNQAQVAAIAAAAGVLGGLIVKLTPTKTDDKWFAALMSLFGRR